MSEDSLTYTMEERMRIEKTARRNVRAESTLILTAGFGALMVGTFFSGGYTFLPMADILNIRPSVAWAVLSFGLAVVWSWLHFRYFNPKVSKAQQQSAAFLYQYKDTARREREAKLRSNKAHRQPQEKRGTADFSS